MRRVSRALDSIWRVSVFPSEEQERRYAELKARRDAHRADAARLSDRELQDAHDDLAEDIELDKHNQYDLLGHLFGRGFGSDGPLPERTEAERAHDDLVSRHDAFGEELDARGLWGPATRMRQEQMLKRINDWPTTRVHQRSLLEHGDITPENEVYWGDDFDRYMAHGGFTLDEAESLARKHKAERDRLNQKQLTKWFGYGGFDPSNPEHHAIRDQLLREYGKRGIS